MVGTNRWARFRSIGIVAFAFFAVVLLETGTLIPLSNGTAPNPLGSSACANTIKSGIHENSRSIDVLRAVTLADSSLQFKQESASYELTYTDTASTWSFNRGCIVTSLDYVEVYYLAKSAGVVKGNFVVSESANLSKITSTEFQNYSTRDTQAIWSGYEMTGNIGATNPVYETTASWSVPGVQAPSGGCNFYCDLSIWPGMTAQDEGGSGSCTTPCLIQAGTDSCVSPYTSCYNRNAYDGWWELLGSSQGVQYCANFPVAQGDSMEVDIFNEYAVGGSVNQYEIYVYDFTSGKTCSPTPNPVTFSMGTPYYGDYIAETVGTLPKFTTSINIQGSIYYNGALQSIHNPYSHGWDDLELIWPNGCSQQDINVGSVSSTGSFSQTYVNSCGT